MVDIAKLDAVLKYIEDKPEEFAQGSWGHRDACGTAGCIAYHVGRHDGAEMEWDDWSDNLGVFFGLSEIDGKAPWVYAQISLGLTADQADVLFRGGNDLTEMRVMRDLLAAEPEADRNALCLAAYGEADGDYF